MESLGTDSGGAFLILSKPAVCRLRPRLFVRPAVFLSDTFPVAIFVARASSPTTAKRQVLDSDGIYVCLFYSPYICFRFYKTLRHSKKYKKNEICSNKLQL